MKIKRLSSILLLITIGFLTACSASTTSSPTATPTENSDHMEMEHNDGMEHDDMDMGEHEEHEHQFEEPQIDNNGAVIKILSPTDHTTFQEGDSIQVEIELTDFVLAEDGNHWHIYVNGISYGMVTGQTNKHVLNGIEVGEQHIEVFMANGEHEQLRVGDAVAIIVE